MIVSLAFHNFGAVSEMTGVTEAGSAQNVVMASIGGRPFLPEGRASYYVAENDVAYDAHGNAAFHIAHGTRSIATMAARRFTCVVIG
jgi:hypothetical protein